MMRPVYHLTSRNRESGDELDWGIFGSLARARRCARVQAGRVRLRWREYVPGAWDCAAPGGDHYIILRRVVQ